MTDWVYLDVIGLSLSLASDIIPSFQKELALQSRRCLSQIEFGGVGSIEPRFVLKPFPVEIIDVMGGYVGLLYMSRH